MTQLAGRIQKSDIIQKLNKSKCRIIIHTGLNVAYMMNDLYFVSLFLSIIHGLQRLESQFLISTNITTQFSISGLVIMD